MGNPSKLEIVKEAFEKYGPNTTIDQVRDYAIRTHGRADVTESKQYVAMNLGKLRRKMKDTQKVECEKTEKAIASLPTLIDDLEACRAKQIELKEQEVSVMARIQEIHDQQTQRLKALGIVN